MNETKIKSVTIIIQSGTRQYTVGVNGVTRIKESIEQISPQGNHEHIFYVDGENNLIAKIINCPVEVQYE